MDQRSACKYLVRAGGWETRPRFREPGGLGRVWAGWVVTTSFERGATIRPLLPGQRPPDCPEVIYGQVARPPVSEASVEAVQLAHLSLCQCPCWPCHHFCFAQVTFFQGVYFQSWKPEFSLPGWLLYFGGAAGLDYSAPCSADISPVFSHLWTDLTSSP